MATNSSSTCRLIGSNVLIENAGRVPNSPKTIVLNIAFMLANKDEPFQGQMLWYNANDITLPDMFVATVHCTIAQIGPNVKVFGDLSKFSFVGDVKSMEILGSPEAVPFDFDQPPRFIVCGPATNIIRDEGKFTVEGEQYTMAHKEALRASNGTSLPKSTFSAEMVIQDSGRYDKRNKPMPYPRKFVMVEGVLTDIRSDLAIDDTVTKLKTFCIDVDDIVFLGSFVPPAGSTGSPATQADNAGSATPIMRNRFKRRIDALGAESDVRAGKRPDRSDISGSSSPAGPSSSPSPFNGKS